MRRKKKSLVKMMTFRDGWPPKKGKPDFEAKRESMAARRTYERETDSRKIVSFLNSRVGTAWATVYRQLLQRIQPQWRECIWMYVDPILAIKTESILQMMISILIRIIF